jgi:hypothetical protein
LKKTGFVALILLSAFLTAYAPSAQCTEPEPPAGEVLHGSVAIPVSANITKDVIKEAINKTVQLDTITANVESVRAKLVAEIAKLGAANDPPLSWEDYIVQKIAGHTIETITAQATAKINDAAADIKAQMVTSIDTAATTIKTQLDRVAPKAVVGGNYVVLPVAEKGWKDLEPSTTGAVHMGATAMATANFNVVITPGGVGINFPVKLEGTVTAAVDFTAKGPSVTNQKASTTTASITPVQDVRVSVSVFAGAGIGMGVGVDGTVRTDYDRVTGELVAGLEKK